jgi:hypothetical protein
MAQRVLLVATNSLLMMLPGKTYIKFVNSLFQLEAYRRLAVVSICAAIVLDMFNSELVKR